VSAVGLGGAVVRSRPLIFLATFGAVIAVPTKLPTNRSDTFSLQLNAAAQRSMMAPLHPPLVHAEPSGRTPYRFLHAVGDQADP
jgi:hypothetical protein